MNFLDKNKELLSNIKSEFSTRKIIYDKIYDYCVTGKSEAYKDYKNNPKRSNLKVRTNFIKKFIKEEVSYLLSNKPTYISKSDNVEEVEFVNFKLSHWNKNHDKMLLRDMLSYGSVFELYYTSEIGEEVLFNSKIVSPRDGYLLTDEFGKNKMFLRFFKKKFDTRQYIDIYTSNLIYHVDDSFTEVSKPTENMFGEVPVGVGHISAYKEHDTLFNELKDLQDAYETNLSDIVNEISDYRLAYLIMLGCSVNYKDKDEHGKTQLDYMKEKGIINANEKDVIIKFLTKDINDTFIQNTLDTLKKNIYEISSHIDTNEKLQSNTSGSALRNRLIGLEQRVRDSEGSMKNIIQGRMYFLFKLFKKVKNINYDYRDMSVKFTLNIPQDDLLMAQTLSQFGIGENISLKTALAQLSFINNPDQEIKLIEDYKNNHEVNIDKILGE